MPQTKEGQRSALAAWTGWFGGLGSAVIDSGNPFGPSAGIGANGSVSNGGASGLTGYSLLVADSIAAATEMAKGCPVLANDGSVEVYETFNIM